MQDLPEAGFSIVVPTHRRTELVERLLASLDRARAGFAGKSEVLVLDSSPRDEAEAIRQSCLRWQASYEATFNDVRRKRNLGISRAQFELVLFIDSDCEADAEVLNQHWSSHQATDPVVAGVTGLTGWSGPAGRAGRVLEAYPALSAAFSLASWLPEVDWATCTNLSVRREVLLEIGGFAESFPLRVYGEDVDLGLRLRKRGYRILCNPQAVVLHSQQTFSSPGAMLRKAFRTGRADYHLGELHPERLCPEFPLPLAISLMLLAAAALRTLAGGPPLLLAAPAAWLVLFIIGQSMMARGTAAGGGSLALPYRAAAVLLEISFELGRLAEALPRLRLQRLWTKFIYVREQLAAERPRRVVQMWAELASLLLLLLFV
jgi:GT2 family glycosyltransferase